MSIFKKQFIYKQKRNLNKKLFVESHSEIDIVSLVLKLFSI